MTYLPPNAPSSRAIAGTQTGLWIKIKTRFGPRLSEWGYSAHMIILGLIMAAPQRLTTPHYWAGWRIRLTWIDLATQPFLGYLLLFVGAARLGALIVNGFRPTITPWIRVIAAAFGFLIWTGICAAHLGATGSTLWIGIYPVWAVMELFNVSRASKELGANLGHS